MATYTVTTLIDENEGGAGGTGLSLREALALAGDNDEIVFDAGLSGGTSTLTLGELVITQDDILIDGDIDNDGVADITIDANDASRVMSISSGSSGDNNGVTLDGLTLTEGYAAGEGGGVDMNIFTSLYLINTNVISNSATTDGGGIHAGSYTVLNISGGSIDNNYAGDDAGGIYTGGLFTSALFDGVTISNNMSEGDAAGVFANGDLTILNSVFSGNITEAAGDNGGALHITSGYTTTARNTVFTDNSAYHGGAIYNNGTFEGANILFSGNSATRFGGGIYNRGDFTLTNGTIIGNNAEYGGGLYQYFSLGDSYLYNTTVTGNLVDQRGGGIFSVGGEFGTRLTNSIVYGNETSSGVYGGTIYDEIAGAGAVVKVGGNIIGSNIYDGAADVGDTTLADVFATVGANAETGVTSGLAADNGGPFNTVALNATGDAVDAGYAAALPGDTRDVDEDGDTAEFLPVDARGAGFRRVAGDEVDLGAVEVQSPLIVTTLADGGDDDFDDGTLIDETNDGGGLSLREALALAADDDTILFDAGLSGGTINLSSGALVITQDGLTIDGDINGDDIADIELKGAGAASVLQISEGSESDLTDVTLNGLRISGGMGTYGGGISASNDVSLAVANSYFAYNAAANGGAIYLGSNSQLVMSNSQVYANYLSAPGSGGGIFLGVGGEATISGSTFYGNYTSGSEGYGGALYLGANSDVEISDSTFGYNGGWDGGGAVFGGANTTIAASGSTFNNNITGYGPESNGGAIRSDGGASLSFVNSEFIENQAQYNGGAIYSTATQHSFGNTTFAGNDADEGSGGALALGGSNTTIVNSTFYGNDSDLSGGAIETFATSLSIYNSTFTGNNSEGNGGAVHALGVPDGEGGFYTSNVYMANSIFAGNEGFDTSDDIAGTEYGSFTSLGSNIFTFAHGYTNNLSDIYTNSLASVFNEVKLNPFTGIAGGGARDNGGPVRTVLILRGGLADGAGNAALLPVDLLDLDDDLNVAEDLPVEQRGLDRLEGGALDIGALQTLAIIQGTGGPDTPLNGTAFSDQINGLGGNDSISGLGGSDTVFAGTGADTVAGGSGDDVLAGGDGDDFLSGQDGDDTIFAGNGFDTVSGGAGDDSITGFVAGDSVVGGDGEDTIFGGDGNDTLAGNDDDDIISGNPGADSLFGGAGEDTVDGGDGNDFVTGFDDDDLVTGALGSDTVYGGNQDDTVIGGNGDDFVAGNSGGDELFGGVGNDTADGGLDNDQVAGDAGNDSVTGNAGDDTVFGGSGADTVIGGTGNDSLIGNSEGDQLFGGDGNDTMSGGDGNDLLAGNAGVDVINGNLGDDTINGGDDSDVLLGGDNNDQILGAGGADILNGGTGDDTLEGGSGDDLYAFSGLFNGGDDVINGFQAGAATDDQIELAAFGSGLDEFSEVLAAGMDVGGDWVLDLGGGNTLTLIGVQEAQLDSSDFIFI